MVRTLIPLPSGNARSTSDEESPWSEAYSPLVHTDLTEQTYQVLKDKILRRDLLPGQKICVDEVARALGVSRTPVNGALKRLGADGLVEILPRRGTFVSGLTAQEVDDWFDVRLMIELFAAECVLSRAEVDEFLAQIEEPMDRMQRAINHHGYRDYMTFMDADRDLHYFLVNATRNDRLASIYAQLNVHMQVARAHYVNGVEDPDQAQAEHEAIAQAFREQDPELVKQAIVSHITNVKSRILELLQARGGQL
jgi:DNA-binding GntR family transcriptional regulator